MKSKFSAKQTKHIIRILKDWNVEVSLEKNKDRYEIFVNDPETQRKIAFCMSDSKVMFCFAKTQSGKTKFKNVLLNFLINNNLTDVGIILTTNSKDALNQLSDRTKDSCRNQRISFLEINNIETIAPGTVITGLNNKPQVSKLNKAIEEQCLYDQENNLKQLRYTVVFDEGEEREAANGCNENVPMTDKELYNLFFKVMSEYDAEINFVKVSATLGSAFMTYPEYTTQYGNLYSEQVFNVPLSSDYIGIGHSLEIDDTLYKENSDIFHGLNIKCENLESVHDSENLPYICDWLIEKYESEDFNPNGIMQLANLMYGNNQDGHSLVSTVMADYYENNGYECFVLDKTTNILNMESSTEIGIIVQNGNTKYQGLLKAKIKEMCNITNGNIKLIIVVAEKMAAKSITVDTDEYDSMYDINSNQFGAYCNLTVLYSNHRKNIDMVIQGVRSSGNRPKLKTHAVLTTPENAKEMVSYYDDLTANINQLEIDGYWDEVTVLKYTLGMQRKYGTNAVNSKINIATDYKREFISVSEQQRNASIASRSFKQRDILLEVDSHISEMEKEEIVDFLDTYHNFSHPLKSAGFDIKINKRSNLHNQTPNVFRMLMKSNESSRSGAKDGADIVIRTFEQDGKNYLYACLHLNTHQNHTEYNWKMEEDGTITFKPQLVPYIKSKGVILDFTQ
jgi:hypothetical protein